MTGNDTNTKGTKMNASIETITAAMQGMANGRSAREIARACGVEGLKNVAAFKRVLAKMTKAGVLRAEVVKAWHKVDIQGRFGGSAVGVHKETRYTLASN